MNITLIGANRQIERGKMNDSIEIKKFPLLPLLIGSGALLVIFIMCFGWIIISSLRIYSVSENISKYIKPDIYYVIISIIIVNIFLFICQIFVIHFVRSVFYLVRLFMNGKMYFFKSLKSKSYPTEEKLVELFLSYFNDVKEIQGPIYTTKLLINHCYELDGGNVKIGLNRKYPSVLTSKLCYIIF